MKKHSRINSHIRAINERTCLTLCKFYSLSKSSSERNILLYPAVYPNLLKRFLLVLINLLSLNQQSVRRYLSVLHQNDFLPPNSGNFPLWKRRIKELLLIIAGLRYFTRDDYPVRRYSEINGKTDEICKLTIVIPIKQESSLNQTLLALAANHEVILVSDKEPKPLSDDTRSQHCTYVTGNPATPFDALRAALPHINSGYICLIDPDIVLLPESLEKMVQLLQREQSINLVVPKILNPLGLVPMYTTSQQRNKTTCYLSRRDSFLAFSRELEFYNFQCVLLDRVKADSILSNTTSTEVRYQPLSEVIFTRGFREPIYSLPAPASGSQRSVIIIDSHLPMYDRESGSNRIFHIIKAFQKLSFHVIFIPVDGERKEPYYSELVSSGIEVLICSNGKKDFEAQARKVAKRAHVCWISRPEHNVKYQFMFKANPELKWIYDTVDLHYVRLERNLALIGFDKKVAKRAAWYRKNELKLATKAALTICITSTEERELINQGIDNVMVVPNVHNPAPGTSRSFQTRSGIIFIGSYLHHPNVDAVLWLCKEIMPVVWKSNPDITLTLLGNQPTEEVLNLRSDKVIVTGYVHDVSEQFNRARIFVAPLRYGAGMKGKVGQSLEYALPVITTSIGAEGMNLEHGRHALIADDALSFAQQILKLENDESLWNKLHQNSEEAIKPYTSASILQILDTIDSKLSQ